MTVTITLIGGLIASVRIERRRPARPLSTLVAKLLLIGMGWRR